jgi:hypothetical protein
MDWRAAADVLDRERALPVERQVAGDLRHDIGHMIGDRRIIEPEIAQKPMRLQPPFADNLPLATPEHLGQTLDGTVVLRRHWQSIT